VEVAGVSVAIYRLGGSQAQAHVGGLNAADLSPEEFVFLCLLLLLMDLWAPTPMWAARVGPSHPGPSACTQRTGFSGRHHPLAARVRGTAKYGSRVEHSSWLAVLPV